MDDQRRLDRPGKGPLIGTATPPRGPIPTVGGLYAAGFPGASAPAPPPPAAPVPLPPRFGPVVPYLLRRGLAFVIDVVLVGALLAASFLHLVAGGGSAAPPFLTSWEFSAPFGTPAHYYEAVAAALAAAHLFSWLCEAIFGSTVGKLVFGLGVGRKRGGHAGLVRTFARACVRPLDLFLIGPLLIVLTPQRQRLGDLVAGTVVGRSSIGPFAPLLGLGLVALLCWAQLAYGGGLDPLRAFGAETGRQMPDFLNILRTAANR
jgi:uncharacterized RDD family membrane protein YckC